VDAAELQGNPEPLLSRLEQQLGYP